MYSSYKELNESTLSGQAKTSVHRNMIQKNTSPKRSPCAQVKSNAADGLTASAESFFPVIA